MPGKFMATSAAGLMGTASDLLRQAVSGYKSDEDMHSPLPSGVQTPQVDPQDKRFPSIKHAYYQATPPRSPRSSFVNVSPQRDTDSRQPQDSSTPRPPTSQLKPPPQQQQQQTPQQSQLQEPAKTNGRESPAPPVAQLRGKLNVQIIEARGLRTCQNPYVICAFDSNEDISKGPLDEDSGSESDAKSDRMGGVPIKRSGSDMGRSIAIPLKSRQNSITSTRDNAGLKTRGLTDPKWHHDATFDVLGVRSDLEFHIYDVNSSGQESFLGHLRMCPNIREDNTAIDGWFGLQARENEQESVTGEILLKISYQKTEKKHYGPEDFQILKLIGKGTFGQVYQVRKKDTQRIYAMKVLSKKVIVQKKEVAHTLGERNILVRTAMTDSPFIVGLKFSFQTPTDLYLVTDFMSGGELFWHLQKEGRFNETRAKFYIAELILALQHLHQHNIVYRDLKPENILLDANGHVALCDFGLSKANLTKNDTTNTFCGTTEYLAPEVLLDEAGYTTMVDFWSLGVLVFEMCCGWSPFYAEDTQQMYKNIAFGKVRFPRDALSTEGRNFVKGLLNRNPRHRLGANNDAEELKAHPFFDDVDWNALQHKSVVPPFKPKLKSSTDTSHFDPEFTTALENSSSLNARAAALASGMVPDSTPLSPGMQANFAGFTFVDERNIDEHFREGQLRQLEEEKREEDPEGWEQSVETRGKFGGEDKMSGVMNGNDEPMFASEH